jgi:hypothetical protein
MIQSRKGAATLSMEDRTAIRTTLTRGKRLAIFFTVKLIFKVVKM